MARTLKSGPGHNSGMIDGEALKRYVERILRLHEGRDEITADIKAVYEESKEAGFVTKQLRQLVREQRMVPQTLENHLAQMDALRHALGQLQGTPLGAAAERGRFEDAQAS